MAGKTSLKRFRNVALQRKYRAENSRGCEVFRWFTPEDQAEVKRIEKTNADYGLELHHILRQPGYKRDNWSNFAMVGSRVHHAFGHDSDIFRLTAVCLYAKFKKGEFDVDELSFAARRPTLRNELNFIKGNLTQPEYISYCDEMLNTLPEE